MDKVNYPKDWMEGMAHSIVDNVYVERSKATPAEVQVINLKGGLRAMFSR